MTKSTPLVFFGTEDFSAVHLRALIDAGYKVVAVVTKPDTPRGRNRTVTPPLVKTIAESHKIKVFQPKKLAGIFENLKAVTPACGVLAAYGKIVPTNIIELFTPGIINVHPSLLPKYRGPSPIETAILNGDKETGVSIMELAAKMDAGPVYIQNKVALLGTETRPELYKKLADEGSRLLVSKLPDILNGRLVSKPQDDKNASYCPLLTKDMGMMDPEKFTAQELERQVRAYLGFPKSQLTIDGKLVIVTKAKIVQENRLKTLTITCKQNTFLEILELTGANGKTMSGQAFYNGYL